jgi:hypothetical protein
MIMRYQLRDHGWAIGAFLIPEGRIVDTDLNNDFGNLARGLNPPLNAQPLDQATYNAMKAIYEPLGMTSWIITVPGADGIIR